MDVQIQNDLPHTLPEGLHEVLYRRVQQIKAAKDLGDLRALFSVSFEEFKDGSISMNLGETHSLIGKLVRKACVESIVLEKFKRSK